VLLGRAAHLDDSSAVLAAVERREVGGMLGATSITTIHYLATKTIGARRARKHMETLLDLFTVARVTDAVLRSALSLPFDDYEDAVLHEAALAAGADGIVTRNVDDFRKSKLPIYSPGELLALLRGR
jgi:hypothetical protein